MKKCPTCDKTFNDNLRFCQTDGTPLLTVAETAPDDPYKTMVASQEEIAASIPLDPFKTMVAGMPIKEEEEEEVLELPDKPDPFKTPVFSQEDIKTQIKTESGALREDPPPPPFGNPPPTYPPLSSSDDLDSAPPSLPKFNEPNLNPPNFSDLSSRKEDFSNKSFSPEPESPVKPAGQSPFDKPISPPIPSPFDKSMPPGYHPPTTPPFAEPEKKFGTEHDSASQSPFGQQFGQQQSPFEQQSVQPSTWSPPPAPEAGWQNQEIGQNTPFQPPVAGSGQNNTLAIVSLVLGILSFVCLSWLGAVPAIITGFMQRNNVKKNPTEYGGGGMAMVGIILGAINIVLSIIVAVIYILLIAGNL